MTWSWEAIGAVAELLGAAGVIASLIYLAHQVRHSAYLSRQEAARSVMSKLNATMDYLAASHDRSDLWVRGSSGLGSLRDEAEVVQFSAFLITFFRTYEELFYYRKRGVEWDWGGFEAQVRATLAAPGVREWWTTRSDFLSAEFKEQLKPLLDTPVLPLYGEGGFYAQRAAAREGDTR